mgnify:CR=1 FL=1
MAFCRRTVPNRLTVPVLSGRVIANSKKVHREGGQHYTRSPTQGEDCLRGRGTAVIEQPTLQEAGQVVLNQSNLVELLDHVV